MTGGSTNKLYRVNVLPNKEKLLVRIYGKGTGKLIDRDAELHIMKTLEPTELGPKVFGTFSNGYLYEYFEGQTLSPTDLRNQTYAAPIAQHLAQWHRTPLDGLSKEPIFWSNVYKWMSEVPDTFSDPEIQQRFEAMNIDIEKEIEIMKTILDAAKSPLVLSHNDVQSGNIILNPKNQVKFIDMEYAGANYRGFDLANHFCEYSGLELDYQHFPNATIRKNFLTYYLKEYLGGEPKEEEINSIMDEVDRFVAGSHFMWGIWALVQAEHSDIEFDYLEYGRKRFEFYQSHKAELLKK